MRLAEPRLRASIMISASMTHSLSGAGQLWMTKASLPRTDSLEPDEDLAVGEVAPAVCGVTLTPRLVATASASSGCAPGEQHQVLAVVGSPGHGILNLHSVGLRLGQSSSVVGESAAACAARAAAESGRLATTHPSMVRCSPAETASAPVEHFAARPSRRRCRPRRRRSPGDEHVVRAGPAMRSDDGAVLVHAVVVDETLDAPMLLCSPIVASPT